MWKRHTERICEIMKIWPSDMTYIVVDNEDLKKHPQAYQNALKITKVGSSFFTPTGAAYTPTNGELVFTKAAHGLVNGDRIRLAKTKNSILRRRRFWPFNIYLFFRQKFI